MQGTDLLPSIEAMMSPENETAANTQPVRTSGRPGGNIWLAVLRGVVGGIVGGVLGYYVFNWMLSKGYYALVLPGSLVGMGCGLAAGRKVIGLGLLSALGAMAVGALADWNSLADPNPTIAGHLATLFESNRRLPALLILTSVAISFYFGIGRNRR